METFPHKRVWKLYQDPWMWIFLCGQGYQKVWCGQKAKDHPYITMRMLFTDDNSVMFNSHWPLDCGCNFLSKIFILSWWRHQMVTFPTLLALCAGNSLVTGEFPSQRPVKWSFHLFSDLRLNKRLSKQSCCWWLETPSRPWWQRHNNVWYLTLIGHFIVAVIFNLQFSHFSI